MYHFLKTNTKAPEIQGFRGFVCKGCQLLIKTEMTIPAKEIPPLMFLTAAIFYRRGKGQITGSGDSANIGMKKEAGGNDFFEKSGYPQLMPIPIPRIRGQTGYPQTTTRFQE